MRTLAWLPWVAALVLTAGCGGCDDSGTGASGAGSEGGGPTGGSGPVCTDCTPVGDTTYALPSPAGATVWTTTTMDKVLREAQPPTTEGAEIEVFAAKNEHEPFQIVVHAPGGGTATLALSELAGPGVIDRVEIERVEYVSIAEPSDPGGIPSGRIPDALVPTSFGTAEPLPPGENQPFWITVTVPPSAPAGDYTATLTVDVGGSTSEIPVRLHVFDFALPAEIGFDGNWNASMEALGGGESLEAVQSIKDFFYEHRLVPSSVAWPAGLNYTGGIEFDCASGTFLEEDNPYDFSQLGPKYIDGEGWNGVGFPSFQIMQFVDNSTPRPQSFCGVDRGPDPFGTAAYNDEWSRLLSAIDDYLVARGWEGKGYYYVQNEPQGPEDYDVAAFLAALTKQAAPNLRIAISEEPKPEIAQHPSAAGQSYDLWWANLSEFDPEYARTRQELGETVWWYFLYGDLPPHFNPITIDHPGIESRIGHWAAWKYRVKGFAYYSVTGWGADPYNDPRPQGTNQNGDGFLLYPPQNGRIARSIRWALLREGVEDWEYLKLAAGGVPDAPGASVGCDATVDSAVSSTTSFTRDAAALKHLRDELGAYLGGERDGCPLLDSTLPGAHPRGTYAINFQDPAGEPSADPLTVDGVDWLKVGWETYDQTEGYGWSGPYIGDPAIMLTQYIDAPVDDLQRSIIYNDYGRTDTFNWDIENGRYAVTVSVGWYDRTYLMNRVVVEGQVLFDDVETNPAEPYRVATVTVDVADGNVTLEVGQDNEYTMLNWVRIDPAE
ncbi:MAG: DUF4091 domain-containing protein [Polyangiaceae bacterium]|jgi:hypothetical protein|nr:DUF4091 domain-containing protein [Polyangiaceae bacterium]